MSLADSVKDQAITLRQNGHSLKDVAQITHIAKSTASLWLRNVPILTAGVSRMTARKELKRYKMSLKWQQIKVDKKSHYRDLAIPTLHDISYTKSTNKLICAILFWAEGAKTTDRIAFTNSDPTMITSFLRLLRSGFDLDEAKFSVSVHLHEYHNQAEILAFWSTTTKIPLSQFTRPYLKPDTGKNIRPGYKGCITVRYYDCKIAYELEAIYNAFAEQK